MKFDYFINYLLIYLLIKQLHIEYLPFVSTRLGLETMFKTRCDPYPFRTSSPVGELVK